YGRMAYRFDGARSVEVLQDERDLTWSAGRYAVTEIPDRPDVKMDLALAQEWLAFREPTDRTRMRMLLAVSGDDLAEIEPRPDALEVIVTALGADGGQEIARGRLVPPEDGSDVVVRLPLDLVPGSYETRAVVRAAPPRRPDDQDRPP